MKKYKLLFQYSDEDEYYIDGIHECDSIDECINVARGFIKTHPYFKTFEFNNFEQVSHNFYIEEQEPELYDGCILTNVVNTLYVEEILGEINA